jgi:hypothetical protein
MRLHLRFDKTSCVGLAASVLLTVAFCGCGSTPADDERAPTVSGAPDGTLHVEASNSPDPVKRGKWIFRYDTYNDETFWTGTLKMNEVIQSSVDPITALSVGLKVDAQKLPDGLLDTADLTDPATTVALLSLDAVVGLRGHVKDGILESIGITCALCHSTVDNSVAPGIGRRLDGYPNRDLDPGLIISLSPALTDAQKAVYRSWGPGLYDPRFNNDGLNGPVLIAPAYGMKDVPLETYTGDGVVSYWNAYVAVTQMGGQGVFIDDRIGVNVVREPDLVTPKLPDLLAYQLSLAAPKPPAGSYDANAAQLGQTLFYGKARCGSCHEGTTYTDAGETLHEASETGMDPFYATRSATGLYRTTPLRGAWQHAPYFHDGSAATFADVVSHYNNYLGLALTAAEQSQLVEFLKSL